MAFTTPLTWVSQAVTAALLNEQIRDNMNETAPGIASAAGRLIITDAANSIVERIPTEASVATSETTTSSTPADLATAGPAVTVTCGTSVLVALYSWVTNNADGGFGVAGYAVSSATTVAADVDRSVVYVATDTNSREIAASAVLIHTGLTAGSNVFTMKYWVPSGGGTASFRRRRIAVIPF